MDPSERNKIILDVKKRHNIELHPTTFSLCELAAKDIIQTAEVRKKQANPESDAKFRAKLISDAASHIANENGATKAGILPAAIIIIIIAAIIFVLIRQHGVEGQGGWTDFVKSFTSFGIGP